MTITATRPAESETRSGPEPVASGGAMALPEHLREARVRAVRAAAALLIGLVAGFVFADPILDVLRTPIEQLAESRSASLNYDTVTAAFDLKVRIALFTAVVLSSPVWLTELLAFVSPGLTRREKRYTFGFAAAAVPLFGAGCVFGFLLFPRMVEVLTGIGSEHDSTILTAGYYVDFVMKIVLAMGIAFVLPVFVVALNLMGVVSAATLRRSWRVIVVLIAVFSALVTPAADVLSMFLVAVPMALLFCAAVLITHLHHRRSRR
ncbi:twin-arginine translocase subunit TatC [Gordonia iterans]|uniref:Sec-independent protein translocase protein TatC n=1 Tax=Gordonia iterans TaxID=1004901 RepID=A0A2S0KHL9_9ACTN|nr:twin-arginine translocase subunit TatC [Gordonia iterans]AVM01131.1 twin-arginine translocase subunit TatC [Gordonia iterans]